MTNHSSKRSYQEDLANEGASIAVDESFARYQEQRQAERQRVARNRRRAAVIAGAGAVAITVVAVGGAEVIQVAKNKSHEIVVEQNADALKNTHGFRDGQLFISAGTRVYGAPDTQKDPIDTTESNAQEIGVVPEGGFSIIDPLMYEKDGQDWYGFVDLTVKNTTNPAEKIHWVSGQALNVKGDNGYYLANWEGGLVPEFVDNIGFDKTGNPIDPSELKQDKITPAHIAFVDTGGK